MSNDSPGQEKLTRRKLIAGAALGLGASAMLRTGEAKAGTFTPANVKDSPYGAAGNGVIDDTAAINNAIAANVAVYLPAGTYLIGAGGLRFIAGRDLRIFGDGPDVTKILVTGSTGLHFEGSIGDFGVDQLIVHDLGFVASGVRNSAIEAFWSGSQTVAAATLSTALISNVEISYNDSVSRFTTGITLSRAPNSRIRDCILSQGPAQVAGTKGIYLTSPAGIPAPDTQIAGCQLIGQDVAIWIDNLVEGIRIINTSLLGVNTGVYSDGSTSKQGKDWIYVQGCHINFSFIGIHATNTSHLTVIGNNFLANPGPTYATMFGIIVDRMVSTDPNRATFNDDGLIAHNTFHSDAPIPPPPSPPPFTTYGIWVAGIAGWPVNDISIEGNRFDGSAWTYSAVFNQYTSANWYASSNVGDSGETVADSSGGQNKTPGVASWGPSAAHQVTASVGGPFMGSVSGPTYSHAATATVAYDWPGQHLVNLQVQIIIFDNGSAGGNIQLPNMPFAPTQHCILAGSRVETGSAGMFCQGFFAIPLPTTPPTPPSIVVTRYDSAYPAATGAIIVLSGTAYV
jgi:hypothetical protein